MHFDKTSPVLVTGHREVGQVHSMPPRSAQAGAGETSTHWCATQYVLNPNAEVELSISGDFSNQLYSFEEPLNGLEKEWFSENIFGSKFTS